MTKLKKQVSVVFHQYETGVRSGTIKPGVTKLQNKLCLCAKILFLNKVNMVDYRLKFWPIKACWHAG